MKTNINQVIQFVPKHRRWLLTPVGWRNAFYSEKQLHFWGDAFFQGRQVQDIGMSHPALPRPTRGKSAAQEGPAFMGLWCRHFAKGLLDVLMSSAALVHPRARWPPWHSRAPPCGERSKCVSLNTSQFSNKMLKGISLIQKISKNNWRGAQNSSSQGTKLCCTELSSVWLAGLHSIHPAEHNYANFVNFPHQKMKLNSFFQNPIWGCEQRVFKPALLLWEDRKEPKVQREGF